MDVGRTVAHARRKRGLSQRELADAAGVPQPAIARWETGRVSPTAESLTRVLTALGQELVVRPRRGIGIDRTVMRERLKLPVAERIRIAAIEAENLRRFHEALNK